jgi:hypothetical protein
MAVLRITRLNPGERPAILKLEGRLHGAWVAELGRVAQLSADEPSSLLLDVVNVSFADGDGVEALRTLLARGAGFRGASAFLMQLVRGESHESA